MDLFKLDSIIGGTPPEKKKKEGVFRAPYLNRGVRTSLRHRFVNDSEVLFFCFFLFSTFFCIFPQVSLTAPGHRQVMVSGGCGGV